MTIRYILITQLLIWLILGAVSPIRAAEPATGELLFSASFDRLTEFADYARGNPESTLDASLELRAKPDIRGTVFWSRKVNNASTTRPETSTDAFGRCVTDEGC